MTWHHMTTYQNKSQSFWWNATLTFTWHCIALDWITHFDTFAVWSCTALSGITSSHRHMFISHQITSHQTTILLMIYQTNLNTYRLLSYHVIWCYIIAHRLMAYHMLVYICAYLIHCINSRSSVQQACAYLRVSFVCSIMQRLVSNLTFISRYITSD